MRSFLHHPPPATKSRVWATALATLILLAHAPTGFAQATPPAAPQLNLGQFTGGTNTITPKIERQTYIITANDVVWLKVYQEEDLETKAKVDRNGVITVPLLGPVVISGKSVEEASKTIRDMLDKRFIVNPQVSLTVVEYSKRKFTMLGQVQRTGVYEFGGDEKVTLLQAIALSGGFTRLAAQSKVTVQRLEHGEVKIFKLNAEEVMKNPRAKPFEVLPDDTITVGSRIF